LSENSLKVLSENSSKCLSENSLKVLSENYRKSSVLNQFNFIRGLYVLFYIRTFHSHKYKSKQGQ
jgi:hypothetical protein